MRAPGGLGAMVLRWLGGGGRRPLAITAVVMGVVVVVKTVLCVRRRQRRARWGEAGKGVVVLHIFPRGTSCPSLSPFVVKLETYLRLACIPYLVDFEKPLGPKGKCPWVSLDGEEIGDSHLIIQHLSERFNRHLSSHLSGEQRATAHAMRVMMEEHFFWCNVVWRWVEDRKCTVSSLTHWGTLLPFHHVYRPLVSLLLRHQASMQGVGRHSWPQVYSMAWEDLHALSVYLGGKKYLTGDELTEDDCGVFGMLSQVVWCSPGSPLLSAVQDNFPNLIVYCQRVRERLWPDWNRCLNPPLPDNSLLDASV
ncbi:failed axon connections homolog [Scylla paramamosain]|uniref:failed axon connections homolog n=1 Tax=Scylla paramamosain TaxID=85552 RepID=UPI00308311AC